MIYKYLNGSRGIARGSKGGAGNGSSGGDPQPYDLSALVDPFFITNEYLQTIAGTNKQLQGMRDMLHSLPAPSSAPEIFTPRPNYNIVDQQYTDAEAKLKSIPILGSSIDQHIAQQQALGEQGVALDHQRNQALAQMRDAELTQSAKDEYQNAVSRHKVAEDRRVFDMGIKQQIQANEDVATAIKTDAAKKVGQEFYSLHKMKEMRNNAKALAEMQRNYVRDKQAMIDSEKEDHDDIIAQEFKDQFTNDYHSMKDIEEFMNKYGITEDEYAEGLSSMYNTNAYKTKFDSYKTDKDVDWIDRKNQLLLDFDDQWWNKYGDQYWSYKLKSGGKVQSQSRETNRDKILERLSRKNEKIAVDNNRALREFVEQMNEKQAKIFLKLMSI